MAWAGKTRVSAHYGGRHGGHVQLGEHVVPPKVSFEMDGENGEPDLRIRFEVRDGRPECVEMHITTKPTGRGIRSGDLRVFNIDEMASAVFTRHALRPQPVTSGTELRQPQDEREAWAAYRDVREARVSKRGKVTRAELEEVARVYREHVDQAPTQAVAVIMGYERRTAARMVQRAREAELLPATTPGKRRA